MQLSSLARRDLLWWLLIFVALVALHSPLLTLPYFWDEAGYYVPAARELMLSGNLIPTTTASSAHPPMPMAYLALAWSVFGYAPLVSRVAMLLVSAFGLLQLFRIAEKVANRDVAVGATLCAGLYPVFFAQSSLTHADVMASALALWGLRSYLEERISAAAVVLSLAVLAKETAIIFPVVIFLWDAFARIRPGQNLTAPRLRLLALPAMVLTLWFAYHYARTGFVFGNPEYFRYNVETTFVPLRILLAGLRRLWQVTGYMNLWVLTLSMAAAMLLPPLARDGQVRPRIAIPTQLLLLALIMAHVVGHSLVGGAVLARYMMPVVPLVIVIAISTLWRRVPRWRLLTGFVCATFVVGWFVPPLTSYAPEDNLNYASFVRLHQRAAETLHQRYPAAKVLTAWPASDELTHPYLGYVPSPLQVVRIQEFSFDQLVLARQSSDYDVALLFSTKTPRNRARWLWWERANARFFDVHEDVTPEAAALLLNGRVVFTASESQQWIALIEVERVRNAD